MLDSSRSRNDNEALAESPQNLYLPDIGTTAAADRYQETLRRLRAFYQSLSSVEFQAGVWFNLPDRTGEGEFEYRASGQKYRLRATVDPRLGFASGLDTSYDGEQFQLLYLDDALLSLRREDPGQTPSPFSNPFFLPVSFLSSEGDDCNACELTLGAIADERIWLSRAGAARGLPEKATEGILMLPGKRQEGEPFFFRIVVLPRRNLVGRIEWVRPNGHVFKLLELNHYEPVEGSSQPFPRHMVLSSFDGAGKRLASVHFMVKTIQVNLPLEPESFKIPQDRVKTIIDEDVPTFLKHRQLAPGGLLEGQ